MNQNTQLIPISQVKDNTKQKYSFRNLRQDEVDLLTALYNKHNGNMSEMKRDHLCPIKGNSAMSYYNKLYNFEERLGLYRKKIIERYKKECGDLLFSAKIKAIKRAIELLETRDVDIVTKTGEVITIQKDPFYKEIKAAWEIIKTELGEPTSLSKQENINKEITHEKIMNILYEKSGQQDI